MTTPTHEGCRISVRIGDTEVAWSAPNPIDLFHMVPPEYRRGDGVRDFAMDPVEPPTDTKPSSAAPHPDRETLEELVQGLHATLENGEPDWLARQRCADILLDRAGLQPASTPDAPTEAENRGPPFTLRVGDVEMPPWSLPGEIVRHSVDDERLIPFADLNARARWQYVRSKLREGRRLTEEQVAWLEAEWGRFVPLMRPAGEE